MAITSSTLTGLRAGIVAVLESVAGITVHDHEPKTLAGKLAATVEWEAHERQTVSLPSGGEGTGGRTESMFGGVDLLTHWTVRLYVDVGTRSRGDIQTNLQQVIGAVIGAFDADEILSGQTSGGEVQSSSFAQSAAPVALEPDGTDNATVVVECRCDVLSFH